MYLVEPRQSRHAPGRPKSDVLDCQWLQRLHSYGLLTASFRPAEHGDTPVRATNDVTAYSRDQVNCRAHKHHSAIGHLDPLPQTHTITRCAQARYLAPGCSFSLSCGAAASRVNSSVATLSRSRESGKRFRSRLPPLGKGFGSCSRSLVSVPTGQSL